MFQDLFGWMKGKRTKVDDKAGAASSVPGVQGAAKACSKCKRVMLPGAASCPFCNPQHFGEELQEGTVLAKHKTGKEVKDLGGVVVVNFTALNHGAKGFIYLYEGKNKGASMLLGPDTTITIGRGTENVLALNDAGSSTKHCEIKPAAGGGYQLVDVGSKNGTFVNDKRVKEHRLVNGDLVACGATRIYVGLF
jgi:RNA polymerase subunit RPABC4/transcription elongation factor Spt4